MSASRKYFFLPARARGFTLIELLVVIAIIGILGAGLMTIINPVSQLQKARNATRKNHLKEISTALEIYANDNNRYPIGDSCAAKDCLDVLVISQILKRIPIDPREGQVFPPCNDGGEVWGVRYMYVSDGNNYKLMAHCGAEGPAPSPSDAYYDPTRPTYTFQVSTAGGITW